jgi:hypothetical protein
VWSCDEQNAILPSAVHPESRLFKIGWHSTDQGLRTVYRNIGLICTTTRLRVQYRALAKGVMVAFHDQGELLSFELNYLDG